MSNISHEQVLKQFEAIKPSQLKQFINGEFVESLSGKKLDVICPATEQVLCSVSDGCAQDVELAVQAAEEALNGEWGNMEPQKRQELIYKLADEWDRQVEEMALLEGLNNGTPIGVNRYVIKSITDTWRYSAGWIDKLSGRICVTDKKFHVYTQRSPVGVVGVISPWNFPMWCSLVNVAPAMAMGNCVILKPSEQTPLTALKLADICNKVGIPKGVYNVIMGDGPNAGAPLVSHKKVSKIAFTGSTEVGRLVMKGAAESNLKQVHLELGGKSPVVVCPDVNIDEAVKVAAFSIFNNNGEACTAGSRTFVHADIYDEFIRKLKEHVATFKIGYNLNDETNIGPLVDKEQYDRVKSYIEIGKNEGAKLLIGGDSEGLPTKGYFVKPTIFYDVDDNMRIAREEIFGPVQSILKPWKTLDEVITRCNNTEFGLAAAILTKNVDNMFTFSDRIKCGVCWINNYHNVLHVAEFGGVKQSGFGREAGEEASDNQQEHWKNLESIINNGIAEKAFPGAVLLVANKNGIIYSNAFGKFTYNSDEQRLMNVNTTKFDMASVTKVISTTSAVALLYQKDLISLQDYVVKYFPGFGVNGKSGITIENLLLHNSGLAPDPVPAYNTVEFNCSATEIYHPPQVFSCSNKIFNSWLNEKLANKIGEKYVYSDLSMISLMYIVGQVVKKNMQVLQITNDDLRSDCVSQIGLEAPGHETCYFEAFVRRHVLEKVGMTNSGYIPNRYDVNIPPAWLDESYHHDLIQGYVSDENCYAQGGISGHAGIFSTLGDVYNFMDELMFRRKGIFIDSTTFSLFTTVKNTKQSSRALGWDTNAEGNGSCGSLSKKTFLHLGFSGTQVCGDPSRQLFTIFLTNRVYPDKNVNKIGKYRNQVNSEVQSVYDQYYDDNNATGIIVAIAIILAIGLCCGVAVTLGGLYYKLRIEKRSEYTGLLK